MTIVLAGILVAAALGAAWLVRARTREALTVLVVALPIVLWIPGNAPRWYAQVRRDHNRDADTARAVTPTVIAPFRNIALEQQALAAMGRRETYAVFPRGRWAAARVHSLTGPLTYLESWLQFQLAPRLQVEPARADWLILLDGAAEPPAARTSPAYTVGDDVLARP
jgi:hypothetical protein